VVVTGPSHGALTLNANGSFTYTPAANFNGSDSFTYKANDGQADSNVATVALTINPVNDAPVAVNDSFATNEDTALTITAPGVLANDTDVDGNSLTAVVVTGPSHGALTLNTDGSFTYTPAAGFNGPDSFTYKANDGLLDSNVATVALTVNPVNVAPVLDPIANRTSTEGVPLVFTATASDVDTPSGSLRFSLDGPAPAGAAIDATTGVFTWTATEPQGPAVYQLTIRVGDGALTDAKSFAVTVLEDTTIDAGPGAGDGVPDEYRVVRSGGDLLVSLHGSVIFTNPFASTPSLTINGSTDDDTLIVDLGGGNPIPAGGIAYHGGGPGDHDALILENGSPETIAYTFIDASSGTVAVDGAVISYTGLEPITDRIRTANRTFTFGPGADIITVTLGTAQSTIASAGSSETVTFANPTTSLTIAAGAGNDTVTIVAAQTPPFEVKVDGGSGVNSIQGAVVTTAIGTGTEGADVIEVSETSTGAIMVTVNGTMSTFAAGTRVRVDALGGDDRVTLRNLNVDAVVDAGAGNDVVDGSGVVAGKLTLLGGAGDDTLIGGSGDDRLEGGPGDDTLVGGAGNDTLVGGAGNDRLIGGVGDDAIAGGEGDDVVVWARGDGNDSIDGGGGIDLVVMYGAASADDVSVRANGTHVSVTASGARLDLSGIERLFVDSGAGADIIRIGDLRGTALAFIEVEAGAGNDVVDGSATNAALTLRGGAGDDRLFGGSGNDRIEGGAGRDTIHGGDGNDTIMGDAGDDLLFGDAGNDSLLGGDGDDIILGGAGNDIASGGAGNDLIYGGAGNDTLIGDGGDDVLLGRAGDDFLSGGAGKNVLIGGPGSDTLICGSRKDLVIDGEASDGLLRRLRMCLDAHDLDSNLHSVLDLWRDGSKEAHGRTR